MTKEGIHRGLILAEMLLLALPVSVICLFLGLVLLLTVGFPWGVEEVAIMLFVLIGTLGIVGLWNVAIAFLKWRECSLWWWRAACGGAGLVVVATLLVVPLSLGWEPAEWITVVALGILASPLLVPFIHLFYLQWKAR
ncbi:MAG: hypothetical protein JJU25_14425 [Halomonas sp.]|nr:hypothetical protein [Halomonas sp.]MCC5883813.1 hypothetical protein [Halomonas sp.]